LKDSAEISPIGAMFASYPEEMNDHILNFPYIAAYYRLRPAGILLAMKKASNQKGDEKHEGEH